MLLINMKLSEMLHCAVCLVLKYLQTESLLLQYEFNN